MRQPEIAREVPLAPYTTLGLGGAAEYLCEATDEADVHAALAWAGRRGLPVTCLGGGSNVIVPDAGVRGLVLVMRLGGIEYVPDDGGHAPGRIVYVTAMAGEPFDPLVAACVARGLAGLECLSGIPGSVGAAPIQNIGAYGQEVSQTIQGLRVLDRASGVVEPWTAERCGFGYRDSLLKRQGGAHLVLSVTFALRSAGAPTIRYPELAARLGAGPHRLADVRQAVLGLRETKSMVIRAGDENRRSVGSFFTNPIVPASQAEALAQRLVTEGVVADPGDMPRFSAGTGHTKLSAAWLIERAGFVRGQRLGSVGISSRHSLALVHHGGGTTADLLALAETIAVRVEARFGVRLVREPVLLCAAP